MKTLPPLNELAKEIHESNIQRGFFEGQKNTGEMLMLTVSELSEALEADRKDHIANRIGFEKTLSFYDEAPETIFNQAFESDIKNSFEDEIADTIIRCLDLCAYKKIDIEFHIREKMKYNSYRPWKHGKKY